MSTSTPIRKRRIVVTPTLNMKRQINAGGIAVRVISGAWPSWRITFDGQADAGVNARDSSNQLVNGQVFFPDDGARFDCFFLTTSTLQPSASEDLVLEIWECVTPVYLLNDGRGAGWRYHPIAGAAVVAEVTTAATATLYADSAWGSTGTVDDVAAVEFFPRCFIGGGLSGDGPLKVHCYQSLNKNFTKSALLASWTAAATDLNGQYAVSFESTRLVPWPAFGMKLILEATDVGIPIENYTWELYSRGADT